MDEISKCERNSNKRYQAVFSLGTVYFDVETGSDFSCLCINKVSPLKCKPERLMLYQITYAAILPVVISYVVI